MPPSVLFFANCNLIVKNLYTKSEFLLISLTSILQFVIIKCIIAKFCLMKTRA